MYNVNENHGFATIAFVALVGAVIGFGRLLAQDERVRLKVALGQSIVSAGIATSAFTVLAWIPEAPTALLVGAACLLASLGTSGLTALIQRLLGASSNVGTQEDRR